MRIIFTLFIINFILLSCTGEPDTFEYTVSLKNSTSVDLSIHAYFNSNLVFKNQLSTGQNSQTCNYVGEHFWGFFSSECGVDSLVLTFDNGYGYICNERNDGAFNFSNARNPLLPNGGFENEGTNYEFIITQEDYENAHKLP